MAVAMVGRRTILAVLLTTIVVGAVCGSVSALEDEYSQYGGAFYDDDGGGAPVRKQLQSLWSGASNQFSGTLANNGHQFAQSISTGQRSSSHGGSPPSAPTSNTFDPTGHIRVNADAAYNQMGTPNQIIQAYVTKLEHDLLEAAEGNVSAIFKDSLEQPFQTFSAFVKGATGDMVQLASYGVAQGGGGLGFSFEVYDCNGKGVLSLTGAIGWGYKLDVKSSPVFPHIDAGIGGGASIAMGTAGAATKDLAIGGGGGGTMTLDNNVWTSNFTSDADDGQQVSHDGDLDAIFQTVHSSACSPLSLKGSGGGGGGFLTSGQSDPSSDLFFGASASYTYAAELASDGSYTQVAFDDDSDDASSGAVGTIIAACRKKCLVNGVPGGAFFGCFCPCLKAGIAQQHLPWPHKIVCTSPQYGL